MIFAITDQDTWDVEKQEYAPPVLGREDRSDFPDGNSLWGNQKPISTLVCLKCFGDKFIIGIGVSLIVVKCPKCGWMQLVYSG